MSDHKIQKKVKLFEKDMLKVFLGTLIVLIIIELIAYFILFKDIPQFIEKYGYYTALLIMTVVINATALYHIKSFKRTIPCMTGMMIGMTLGMTSGLSIGMIVGATNGMFFGGLAGVIIGMAVGVWAGNCCGVMGVMEGMMAGIMGGTMGPMIALMSLAYVKPFISFILLMLFLIIISLIYLMYKEELYIEEKTEYKGYSFIYFSSICILVTLILTLIMVYAPKSLLIGV